MRWIVFPSATSKEVRAPASVEVGKVPADGARRPGHERAAGLVGAVLGEPPREDASLVDAQELERTISVRSRSAIRTPRRGTSTRVSAKGASAAGCAEGEVLELRGCRGGDQDRAGKRSQRARAMVDRCAHRFWDR